MKVERFEHPVFTSNTYVLHEEGSEEGFVVDIGEYEYSRQFMQKFKRIPALLLTHAHYDHIYHIEGLLRDHPECKVYASAYTIECLASPKLNLSFYHDDSIAYTGESVFEVKSGHKISLSASLSAQVIATPGHTPGCLSFLIEDFLFTGDALIPGHKVVTKLRGGDKNLSRKSVSLLKGTLKPSMLLCPGHGEALLGKEIT